MADTCYKFMNNPTINPRTGRKITQGGTVYNSLMQECNNNRNQTMQPVSPGVQRRVQAPDMTSNIRPQSPTVNNMVGFEIFTALFNKYINDDVFNRARKMAKAQGLSGIAFNNQILAAETEYAQFGKSVVARIQSGIQISPNEWVDYTVKLVSIIDSLNAYIQTMC